MDRKKPVGSRCHAHEAANVVQRGIPSFKTPMTNNLQLKVKHVPHCTVRMRPSAINNQYIATQGPGTVRRNDSGSLRWL